MLHFFTHLLWACFLAGTALLGVALVYFVRRLPVDVQGTVSMDSIH